MTARVAIYAGVSTINHGQDVSMQTREPKQFAEARGWTVAGQRARPSEPFTACPKIPHFLRP
jgi:hypothetical protein